MSEHSEERPLLSDRWALAVVVGVALVLAFAWFTQWRAEAKSPEAADWEPVWEHLRSEWRSGDGLWVYPTWSAVDGVGLRDVLTEAKADPMAVWLHADPLTVADVARFERLWIVTPRGDSAEDALGDLLGGDCDGDCDGALDAASLQVRLSDGAISLAVVNVAAGRAFDFRSELGGAVVQRILAPGKEQNCRWKSGRHRCPGPWWKGVFTRWSEVGNTRRDVIFAHAEDGAGTLAITYELDAIGSRLVGGSGHLLAAVRREEGSEVEFRIRIDGELAYERKVGPGDFDWLAFDVPTSDRAGSPAEVRFEVSAFDAAWRQYSFDAVAID